MAKYKEGSAKEEKAESKAKEAREQATGMGQAGKMPKGFKPFKKKGK